MIAETGQLQYSRQPFQASLDIIWWSCRLCPTQSCGSEDSCRCHGKSEVQPYLIEKNKTIKDVLVDIGGQNSAFEKNVQEPIASKRRVKPIGVERCALRDRGRCQVEHVSARCESDGTTAGGPRHRHRHCRHITRRLHCRFNSYLVLTFVIIKINELLFSSNQSHIKPVVVPVQSFRQHYYVI